jgi:hypothetical protein
MLLPTWAGVEEDLRERWLGAWVLTRTETWSGCSWMYTNNEIRGGLVKSKGRHGFDPGELAKLVKIDGHRQKIDLFLKIEEPILAPYKDGPFTLYREKECKVEIELMVPRETVKARDIDALDLAIAEVLERHDSAGKARRSATWNQREREPYPDDYEYTLARHAIWEAEKANARVQAKLDEANEVLRRLVEEMRSNEDYVSGFAEGVRAEREEEYDDCAKLLVADFETYLARSDATEEEIRRGRGEEGGANLVLALELIDRLPGCFVPVPKMPPPPDEDV